MDSSIKVWIMCTSNIASNDWVWRRENNRRTVKIFMIYFSFYFPNHWLVDANKRRHCSDKDNSSSLGFTASFWLLSKMKLKSYQNRLFRTGANTYIAFSHWTIHFQYTIVHFNFIFIPIHVPGVTHTTKNKKNEQNRKMGFQMGKKYVSNDIEIQCVVKIIFMMHNITASGYFRLNFQINIVNEIIRLIKSQWNQKNGWKGRKKDWKRRAVRWIFQKCMKTNQWYMYDMFIFLILLYECVQLSSWSEKSFRQSIKQQNTIAIGIQWVQVRTAHS